jgi:ribosomal protein S18 acetylase RimI-like enzyme
MDRLMEINFRPAMPEDAAALVPLVYASGPSTFDYVFTARGGSMDANRYLGGTLTQRAGEFGYGVHLAGVVDGVIVAGGAGYDAGLLGNTMLLNLRQIVGAYGLASAGVIRRGLAVEHLLPPPRGDEWCLVHLGVCESLRGRGIGGQLVSALLEKGRARGCRVAVLDVSLENPLAQILYERIGFRITREVVANLRSPHGHVPGFRRMEMPL